MAEFIPDLLRVVVLHWIPHPGGDFADDLPVGLQIPLRLHRLEKALEAAIRCGIDALMLAPRGRGQNHIGRRGGFGHKDILDDNQLHLFEGLTYGGKLGVGLERIFPHNVRRPHFAVRHAVRQLADAVARVLRQALNAPGVGELLPVFREFHVLIAGIGVRQRAHIAGALDVVLAAHRIDADVRFPQVAGEDRQAGQGTHRFDALPELGYAHPPQNHGVSGAGVQPRAFANLPGADAGDGFHRLRRIAFDDVAIRFEAFGTPGDEGFIVEIFFDNHLPDGVEQRNVGAVFQSQMQVGDARGFDFTRIADDDFGPVAFGIEDVIRHDRVRIRRVIAENKHQIGIIDLGDGITHRAVADRLVQTCNRRAVSDACAAVDVIGTNNGARKFLHDVVGFIACGARRSGGLNRIRPVLRFYVAEAVCHVIERFLPGDGLQLTAAPAADHRGFQARGEDLRVVNKIPAVVALQAQGALIIFPHRSVGAGNFSLFYRELHFAAGGAVGADGRDSFHSSGP